jgi:hypothetical protein
MSKNLICLKQKYRQSSYFFGSMGCVCANHHLFQRAGLQKLHFMIEGQFCLASLKRVLNTGCAALRGIFSSNNSVLANRKKLFYASRLWKNEEISGIFMFSGSDL